MNKVKITIEVDDKVMGSVLFDPTGILTEADRLAGEALANTAASLFRVAHVAAIAFSLMSDSKGQKSNQLSGKPDSEQIS